MEKLGLFTRIKVFLRGIVFRCYLVLCGLTLRLFRIKYLLALTPYHGNLGDHAIVLSEKQFLEDKRKKYLELSTRYTDGNEKLLSAVVPKDTTIIIPGGGFLGSLWPHEELRVRKIIESFPNNKIVIFPQTVTFFDKSEEDKAFFEESKRVYMLNKKLRLFVRDERSYEFVKETMPEVKVSLSPDIVTLLNTDEINRRNRSGVLLCLRSDLEKDLSDEAQERIRKCVLDKYPDEKISYTDTVVDYMVGTSTRREEVYKKLRQFGKSKLVITDRLHGMIMAAITDTPCIAFSNSNGKVRGVYKWIKNNEYVVFVESMAQFEEALGQLDLNKEYKYVIDRKLFADLDSVIGGTDAK